MAEPNEMVKVRLQSPKKEDTETLWAVHLADDLFRLDNSPFLFYGLSWHDVILARPADDNVLEYVSCVTKSGNRTLRVIFQEFPSEDDRAQAILRELRRLGASYEGMRPRLVSINVPPNVNLKNVTDFLADQVGIEWEYADPTYEDVVKSRTGYGTRTL
jgi:hypothetical protein